MKVEWRLFLGAAAFFTAMLAASVPAFAMVALWLAFQARKHGPRPEDDPDAPITAADDLGYFPASSMWPFVLSAGAVVLANGLVFGPPIAGVGAMLMVAGVFGYAREADTKA